MATAKHSPHSANGKTKQNTFQPLPTSKDYLAGLNALGYSFKFNEITNRIEVNNERINDYIREEIKTKLRDTFKYGDTRLRAAEEAYRVYAYRHCQYHPIKNYLESLKYDGHAHIADLAAYCTTNNPNFGRLLKSFLVGAVAKVYDLEPNAMLVLDGSQGIGKSSLVRFLGTPLPEYFVESPITDEKDCLLKIAQNWIWEVGELGASLNKVDREMLKFLLTQKVFSIRAPYDKYEQQYRATASFIGTINSDGAGFLADPTGNRRFNICEIKEINWDYTNNIDIDQVWAEAYNDWKNGYDWKLTPDEIKQQNQINEEYEIPNLVMEFFNMRFSVTTDPAHPAYSIPTSSAKILSTLELIGLKGTQRANQMLLASGLRKLKVKKTRSDYYGIVDKSNP